MELNSKILVLDNYDSFTYNLVHQLNVLGYEKQTHVYRNDKITLEKVNEFDKILLSPGPGIPREAGIMPEIIKKYASSKSILGICLGHQAIAEAFGGSIYNMDTVLHGVTNKIQTIHPFSNLFNNVNKTFDACRYHSWTVTEDSLPSQLRITAKDENGRIMAMEHLQYSVFGLQFHPEAFTTKEGIKIIENWINS